MAEEDKPRPDPVDGLPAMPVGAWAKDKHALLAYYVEITRSVRRKFVGPRKGGATYIDLFCASGRAYIKGSDEFIDGSPLVAWKAAQADSAPFNEVHLNDNDPALLHAAGERLRRAGAPVVEHGGDAVKVAQSLVEALNPYGLHFAFLDPFRLLLPFELIRTLAKLKRIDLLIHVSVMDLQRNWGLYVQKKVDSPLDHFAPGWRNEVSVVQSGENARMAFIRYWIGQLQTLGFERDVHLELITGSKNQPLYWLVLIAKHEIAARFWKKATQRGKTQALF